MKEIKFLKINKMNGIFLLFVIIFFPKHASAEWVKLGENSRSTIYADSEPKAEKNTILVWVMFDYKSVQKSKLSGRRYLTEKALWEVSCQNELRRTTIVSWHKENMGYGEVVYSSSKPTAWETTSAPQSFGKTISKFVCEEKEAVGIENWPGKSEGYGPPSYSYMARTCGDFLAAQEEPRIYEIYLAFISGYISGINSERKYGGNVLGKDNPKISDFALMVRSYCAEHPMQPFESGIAVSLKKIKPATWIDMK